MSWLFEALPVIVFVAVLVWLCWVTAKSMEDYEK